MDAITDLFPLPSSPRKRSAAARSSKLAFLDEIDDDALKTYTPAQLSTILNQRSQVASPKATPRTWTNDHKVLDVARATSEDEIFFTSPTPPSQRPSSPSSPTKLFNKPWVDSKGTECQFKCCHACRPTLSERAFLSLDGIANDDTPLTAAVGFGFHLHAQKRPVALVKHVKNLGLRPPPAPVSPLLALSHRETTASKQAATRLKISSAQKAQSSTNPKTVPRTSHQSLKAWESSPAYLSALSLQSPSRSTSLVF